VYPFVPPHVPFGVLTFAVHIPKAGWHPFPQYAVDAPQKPNDEQQFPALHLKPLVPPQVPSVLIVPADGEGEAEVDEVRVDMLTVEVDLVLVVLREDEVRVLELSVLELDWVLEELKLEAMELLEDPGEHIRP
jgi:hypothetical protein